MPVSARQLVKDISHLVSLPDVCVRMNEVLESPVSSAMDIAEIISHDPSLTARVLKIANSSYYAFPSQIETLSRAITVIGTQDLYQLVLATSVIDSVQTVGVDQSVMDKFWRHSLMTGLIARDLARKAVTPVMQVERVFVAGLLHDIGSIVMAVRIPELTKVMLRCADQLEMSISQAERNVFDLDHGEVGAELMASWNLPEIFQNTARHHHEPELTSANHLEVSLIHIANWAAITAEYSRFDFFYDEPLSGFALQKTGIDQKMIKMSVELARQELTNIIASFLPANKRKAS